MKAAAYYRMSSDDQINSIPQQRLRVEAYAAERGITIVVEFVDDGKSGSREQEKRVDFQRMLADSAKGEWQLVLCLNTSRFGRLDTIDGAYGKQTLRNNGVHLETVEEGRIDWNLAEDRMKEFFLAEANHKRSREISKDSLRGRNDKAKAGKWPYGEVPYGYDRNYCDEKGNAHLVSRQDVFRKPRNWHLELVVNEAEANIVRRIFDEFDTKDTSFRAIAGRLNEDGILSPGGKGWNKDTVKAVLKNTNYIGTLSFGHYARRKKEAFNRATPTEVEDAIPSIVDKAIFHSVQQKLERKKSANSRPQSRSVSPLVGVVVCGHCGKRMERKVRKWGPPENRKEAASFICATGLKLPNMGCRQWQVREELLMPYVLDTLRESVDFELLRTIQSKPSEVNGADMNGLTKQIRQAEKRLDKAAENFLAASPAILDTLDKKMRAIKQEIEDLQQKKRNIEAVENQDQVSVFQSWWDKVKGRLVLMSEITWGEAQSQRQPIMLTNQDRQAIEKHLNAKVGKVRATFPPWNEDGSGGTMTIGEGDMIELDAEGQAWAWREVEFPVQPAVLAEADAARELLHKLGVKLTLFFKNNGRYNELDKGRLQAEIQWGDFGKSYQ